MKAEKLIGCENKLGEGPLWIESQEKLYWVDIEGRAIYEMDGADNTVRQYLMDKRPCALAEKNDNELYVVLEDGLYIWEKVQNKIEVVDRVDVGDDNRFNDGKKDPWGRLWAGTMNEKGELEKGALYVWLEDGTRRTVMENVSISNGLAWNKRAQTMYYIDTPTRTVYQFHYDAKTGALANEEVVYTFQEEDGYPDGMTIDGDGNLWIALFGGYGVAVVDPGKREWIDKVEVPAKNVTCCVFGGPDGDELFITTATEGLQEPDMVEYPDSGSLFHIKVHRSL
ncbi:SMP-30/gluconolactonase/LRE family protein [Bacillus sp. H-16]|uniref:SMP-30/gluconolactonase/LRE family protein n=1 Tax=Alteribacter salitolerans TaxID=2912333 RepID=UPI0019662A12|nr:SMP-30/gluconolactonase/LRE family protein [Alteribacter salitolerans]MBM7095011.1 SMP-30/gluconolactonase/LRE family protein [Alteribacter salitolerans]